MEYIIFGIISTFIWMGYEAYTAPMMDDNGNVIKKGKTLKDLFKKTKNK
jgi:hypothetical protein